MEVETLLCDDFVKKYYNELCGPINFEMSGKYLNYDGMYTNDDIVYWAVFYDNELPIAVACVKQPDQSFIPDSNHLSVFEVNKYLRGQGIGTEVLKYITSDNKTWTLFARPELANFYGAVGFKPCSDFDNFYKKEGSENAL